MLDRSVAGTPLGRPGTLRDCRKALAAWERHVPLGRAEKAKRRQVIESLRRQIQAWEELEARPNGGPQP